MKGASSGGLRWCSLCFVLLLPWACTSGEASFRPPGKDGGSTGVNAAGKSGSAGASSVGGSASAGMMNDGGDDQGQSGGEGAAPGSAGTAANGGSAPLVDKCRNTSDCTQVAGSCFVCEQSGAIKDCVDQGPPVCDNGTLDPCETCEIGDVIPCTELSKAGAVFSGGKASCNTSCNGWDTTTCSVCGNGKMEEGEECDGAEPAVVPSCPDDSENPGTPTPCTDECRFDTTLCNGCSEDAVTCLDGTACQAQACNDAECKLGTSCEIDCSGGGKSCSNVRCNHDATCNFNCTDSGRCLGVVCDSRSTCELDCSGGDSTCDAAVCKAGARCSLNCSTAGKCRMLVCQPGSACELDCSAGGSICSGVATCSAGQTCSFDCSESGHCGGLSVTCAQGSTCSFKCDGGGSVCPKATCESGASCSFACEGPTCNNPTCAEGACTGLP